MTYLNESKWGGQCLVYDLKQTSDFAAPKTKLITLHTLPIYVCNICTTKNFLKRMNKRGILPHDCFTHFAVQKRRRPFVCVFHKKNLFQEVLLLPFGKPLFSQCSFARINYHMRDVQRFQ